MFEIRLFSRIAKADRCFCGKSIGIFVANQSVFLWLINRKNAILYINKTGCQWRMLPSNFAPWQTVYYYFRATVKATAHRHLRER